MLTETTKNGFLILSVLSAQNLKFLLDWDGNYPLKFEDNEGNDGLSQINYLTVLDKRTKKTIEGFSWDARTESTADSNLSGPVILNLDDLQECLERKTK